LAPDACFPTVSEESAATAAGDGASSRCSESNRLEPQRPNRRSQIAVAAGSSPGGYLAISSCCCAEARGRRTGLGATSLGTR
jgi:hypothetical protein